MTAPAHQPPTAAPDRADPSILRLAGSWTLGHAREIGLTLQAASGEARSIDAAGR